MNKKKEKKAPKDLSKFDVYPIFEKLVVDTETPITVLYRFLEKKEFILLEGVSENVKHDRYSYIGLDPYIKITGLEQNCEIEYENGKKESINDTIFNVIETYIQKYKNIPPDTPPYYSGIIGSLSYESAKFIEKIPTSKKRKLKTPLAQFMIPKTLLVFDNHFHTITIIQNIFNVEAENMENSYKKALNTLKAIKDTILTPIKDPIQPLGDPIGNYDHCKVESNVSKKEFMKNVQKCKNYITEGDIFQIQVSRRCSKKFTDNPIMLYRYIRQFNPSPFLFYVKFENTHLIGASPEILVTAENRVMTIRPLAGTRKRYSKDKTEIEIIEELRSDEKEKAEHIMLVDLARHEIGRACEIGSVEVVDLLNIEKYTHVIHMVSEVQGKLRKNMSGVDALKFGFPAGTVTGTPKIRAMEIIAEIEKDQREFYSGGVAFFDFKGNMKSAISIRSMLVKNNMVYTQAAAGIVADSIPEMEYKETENKMRACISAMAQFGDDTC